LFSLFDANPQLIDLIVDIAATAPALARYLGRNAQVFDAVIGGSFFADWPGPEALQRQLAELLDSTGDYERQLDIARRWHKEWHFRIGVHHLRGLIAADECGRQYADLAQAVLGALWQPVVADFARKHGAPPGRGAAVLGMGSLGASRLSAASDLDIIVIYNADGIDTSDGRRPIASRMYYARLTQAFVTALTAQTAEGSLYQVDMRLRPSGRQGPVATSLDAFRTYQRQEAWTWEHLALTRARPLAGTDALCREVEDFRQDLLAGQHDAGKVIADITDMRARLAEAKPAKSDLEAKRGPGAMQDIELLAQTFALISGCAARTTSAQINAGIKSGWISTDDGADLITTYTLLWQIQAAARLLTGAAFDMSDLAEGGREFLLHQTGTNSLPDLVEARAAGTRRAVRIIGATLASGFAHR